jgi:hypothetical protein
MTFGLYSLAARGWVGKGAGCGRARCGLSKCGDRLFVSGIYHRRHKKGRVSCHQLRHYRPTNPRTETQQAWRAIFAQGVEEWHALTPAERAEYNRKARGRPLTGYNLFLSAKMRAAS